MLEGVPGRLLLEVPRGVGGGMDPPRSDKIDLSGSSASSSDGCCCRKKALAESGIMPPRGLVGELWGDGVPSRSA